MIGNSADSLGAKAIVGGPELAESARMHRCVPSRARDSDSRLRPADEAVLPVENPSRHPMVSLDRFRDKTAGVRIHCHRG